MTPVLSFAPELLLALLQIRGALRSLLVELAGTQDERLLGLMPGPFGLGASAGAQCCRYRQDCAATDPQWSSGRAGRRDGDPTRARSRAG